MKITAQTLELIKVAVRRECGGQIGPEDRFDLCQEVALRLVLGKSENTEAHIATLAQSLVANKLRDSRVEREALEHLKSTRIAPAYKTSLKRDPMVNYMAVKASIRSDDGNKVEDAVIACIDQRTRRRLSQDTVPTCPQDLFARQCKVAERKKNTSKRRASKLKN